MIPPLGTDGNASIVDLSVAHAPDLSDTNPPGDLGPHSDAGRVMGPFPYIAFDPVRETRLGSAHCTVMTTGDVNGDGNIDVLCGGGVQLLFVPGRGDGTFGTPVSQKDSVNESQVFLADLDGDGRLDVVVADQQQSVVELRAGDGMGNFAFPGIRRSVPARLAGAALADLDGDKTLDLVTASSNPGAVSFFRGMGLGLAAPQGYPDGTSPFRPVVADFDGDGLLDVATAHGPENSVNLLVATAPGTLGAAQSYPTDDNPFSVAAADLDGDGRADLVSANYDAADITVRRGTANGLDARHDYPVGSHPTWIGIADFNLDGKRDLAVAGFGLAILQGNGDATFRLLSFLDIGYYNFAIADLDRDGRPDIVATNGDNALLYARNVSY